MRSRAYVPFMEQHRLCIKLGHHRNNITQQRLDGGWTNQIVQLPQSSTSAIYFFYEEAGGGTQPSSGFHIECEVPLRRGEGDIWEGELVVVGSLVFIAATLWIILLSPFWLLHPSLTMN